MTSILTVVDGLQEQKTTEKVAYILDVSGFPGTGTISSISAVVTSLSDDEDVTSVVMPAGSHTTSGDTITLKLLQLLTAGEMYRVDVTYTRSGNTFSPDFQVQCKI